MNLIVGILIPFLGTTIGSSIVFLMTNEINKKIEKVLLGFTSGIMIAASVWSLILPALEMVETKKYGWLFVSLGFLFGVLFLLILDKNISYFDKKINKKNFENNFKKTAMMVIAVTLHNIPEGMAVGVIFAGALTPNSGVLMSSAFTLSIGIAIQNIPEGAIISMPLKTHKVSKTKAFIYGTLSGIVEPISSFFTILLTNSIVQILPFLLSFAAGAMIKVVIQELIPDSQNGESSHLGTLGVTFGFLVMMILDVTLG